MERAERGDCMIVVSDTTPLISLMKIGRSGLVEQLFGEVRIPDAVFAELITNPQFSEEAQQIQGSSFIKRVVIDDGKSVDLSHIMIYRTKSMREVIGWNRCI